MTDKANRQDQLEGMLASFHLPSFKKYYLSYARKSELEKLDHVAYLYELSKSEHEDRPQQANGKASAASKTSYRQAA